MGLPFLSASSTTLFGSVIHKIVTLTLRCKRQRLLLSTLWFILINFSASAETIPYKTWLECGHPHKGGLTTTLQMHRFSNCADQCSQSFTLIAISQFTSEQIKTVSCLGTFEESLI